MSITVKTSELFQTENSLRLFLEKTEQDTDNKIPFELTYWGTKLSNKISSALKTPRETLQKLNDKYGITQENANKPLKDVVGNKLEEFIASRDTIMNDEVVIDIFPKDVNLFSGTGIGGYTLMGLLPFLEEKEEEKTKLKKEK
jgi:molybdopterin converting factor small subunit